jgi:conjugative relaxase-like TrwC/TraI family protein
MITVAKATSAGYYTSGGMSGGEPSYYLDAVTDGEPPGQWLGRGAAVLGLQGQVEATVMEQLYGEFVHPLTGEQLGTRPANRRSMDERLADALAAEPGALPERVDQLRRGLERTERKNVIGWDATFNVTKSVTVIHTAMRRAELAALRAGDTERAAEYGRVWREIESAVRDANQAGMQVLEAGTVTRIGGGSGAPLQWAGVEGVTIASFVQHTNRAIEPHLHVHNVMLNRVEGPDGVYRAVDGRELLAQRFHVSAVADRVLGERLAALGLPMQTRADGMAREVPLVPAEVTAHYSTRRQQVTAAVAPMVEAAQTKLGRELTDVELYRLSRQATLATRAAKTHGGETSDEMLDRWYADLVSSTGRTLDSVARTALDAVRAGPVPAQEWSPSSVLAEAVAACAQRSSTWRRANLINEIELRLPTLGVDGDQVAPLLERLADQALARDGVVQVAGLDDDEYAPPSARLFAATGTLAAEAALRRAAVTRSGLAADRAAVASWLDRHAPDLGADQRAAVLGIAGSDAALSVLVGPAGTGKSHAAGALAHAWGDLTGGRVVGLAVSKIATEVLRDGGIPDAATVAAFLSGDTPLGPADVVMVDEASMVGTFELAAVRERVEAAGARLVLSGDPRQLAAVEAGGVLGLLDGHAETYHLSEVRRFTEPWERDASLALRDGDPDGLLAYQRHGRLLQHDGLDAALDAAARAAVADRLDGRSVTVIAGSNAQAARIATRVRDQLVELGLVSPDGVFLERDGCVAGVGDLIACRRNDYTLGATNRAQYRVVQQLDDGGLVVEPLDGRPVQTLPAGYVSTDVQLGYASTVHAAQGMTVDAAHLVTDGGLDAAALYVGLSRGRARNTAHVAVKPEAPELPTVPGRTTGETRLGGDAPRASALAVLESCLDRDGEALAATVAAEQDAARRGSMTTLLGRIETETRLACRARLEAHLDDLAAERTLDAETRLRLALDQGTEHLSRVLRAVEQAGTDPRDALRDAVTGTTSGRRGLADAQSVAQVLAYRITGGKDLPPPATDAGVPAGVPHQHAQRLTELGIGVATRRAELGARVADQAPSWAVLALGPVPSADDPADRADWERRAGIVAAHREATGWTDPEHPLGRMPGTSMTERRADYATAWTALGRPEPRLEEAQLSTGQLLARVRSWQREQAWAPPHADDALRTAEQAAERARQDAALALAEGRAEDADRLRAEADARSASAAGFTTVAESRAAWAARTLVTKARADTAEAELTERGVRPGAEPDRVTAEQYLAGEHPDRDQIDAEDQDRTITDADVHDEIPDDALDVSADSPEVVTDPPAPIADVEAPAHQLAPTDPSPAQLDVLLAQASLATSVAADQASQDDAWQPADDQLHAETADAAGRARREAAEQDANAAEPEPLADAASPADAAGDAWE